MIDREEYEQLKQKLEKHQNDVIEVQNKMAEAIRTIAQPKVLSDDVVWLQAFCSIVNRTDADCVTSVEAADYALKQYKERFVGEEE